MTALRRSIAAVTLCAALVALAAPVASAKPKRGIDVSRFQGGIDWERVGETRVEFAFAQASRGDGSDCSVVPDRCGADERYAANYEGARAAGLWIGAYHRAFVGGGGRRATKQDALSEANLFADQVGELRRRDLRPALDVETPFGGLDQRELRRWIRTWLKAVRGKLGARPIIYTSASSWQATGDTRRFARDGHRLWVANFGVDSPDVPAGNWDGQGWSIWQYTSSGRVAGISGSVDRDRIGTGWRRVSVR